MGKLSTHILNINQGKPAAGVNIELFILTKNNKQLIKSTTTNSNGRSDNLLDANTIKVAQYEMIFYIGDYFAKNNKSQKSPKNTFFNEIPIRFFITNNNENYHIPLLVSPWSYSTYRGS